MDVESTEIGLGNSLFSVCAIYKNEVIGCGRAVGDGGIYFYIQDIIVLPKFQGRGIGKLTLSTIACQGVVDENEGKRKDLEL